MLAGAALSVVACGGDGASQAGDTAVRAGALVHVHGLGVNPRDRALYVATHTGLFRVGQGESEPARVGNGTQDTMGFTVVGPDRFLASGHPGELERAAINPLGLIRSTDGGESWTPLSLEGEADFHILRSAGGRVYGVDSSSGRLLVSGDGGASWEERPTPGPLIDLLPDPADSERLVASSETGLHISNDGGRRWRPLGGAVGHSRDGGVTWSDYASSG